MKLVEPDSLFGYDFSGTHYLLLSIILDAYSSHEYCCAFLRHSTFLSFKEFLSSRFFKIHWANFSGDRIGTKCPVNPSSTRSSPPEFRVTMIGKPQDKASC